MGFILITITQHLKKKRVTRPSQCKESGTLWDTSLIEISTHLIEFNPEHISQLVDLTLVKRFLWKSMVIDDIHNNNSNNDIIIGARAVSKGFMYIGNWSEHKVGSNPES